MRCNVYIFIIFSVILFLLLQLRIKLEVNYINEAETNHLVYRVSMLKGFLHLERRMEFKIKEEKFAVGVKSENNLGERKKTNIKFTGFVKQFRTIANGFEGVLHFTRVSLKKVRLTKSDLLCCIGSENAVTTSQLAGISWTVYGSLMALVQNIFEVVGEHDVKIIPIFSEKVFRLKYSCIFDVTLGHFILVTLKFIYRWKGKRKYLFIPVVENV